MEISVIIPVLNEETNIQMLYTRLTSVMLSITPDYELIFINDGSKDNTLLLIRQLAQKDLHVKYIDFSRNFGHQIAVMAGLDHANGQAIAIIDADLQDPPELLVDMYQKLKNGYEVVYARRTERKGDTFLKKFTASIFYRLLHSISSIDIPLDTGDFRIIDRSVLLVLREMPEKKKYLRGQISWIGFNQSYVEFKRDARHGGKTNYTFKKMINLAMNGITGFSTFPLRVATIMGFLTSSLAFFLIIWVILVRMFVDNAEAGWASTMVAILFMGGIQLISIGILGEYIGRINENTQDRPLYIIRQKSDTLSS